jgi:hypothetical protein
VPASQPANTYVDPAIALPYWTVSTGKSSTQVLYNAETIGESGVSLLGTNSTLELPLDGRFSALLQAGVNPGVGSTSAYIEQTALVPAFARSILFQGFQLFGSNGTFTVTLGAQTLSLLPLQATPNYTLYGADVTPWAGQVEALRFTALATADGRLNNLNLDDITFSATPLPEPGTWALLLSGLAALLYAWRRPR